MQRYHVDDGAGHTLTLEGDSPPTEQELEEIFSTHFSNSSPMGETSVTSYAPSTASLPGGFMDPGDVRSGEFTKALFVDAPQDISAGLNAIMEPVERMASAGVNVFGLRLTEPGKSVIPGVEPEPGATGVIPSLRRAAAGFTTPGTLVTLPFAAESKALQGAFGIGAAASIPQSVQQLAEAKTGSEARGALTDIGISGAIAGGIGKSLTRERNPYASSKSKAAEVYGDVRSQPIEGEGQVSTEEGGQGVQPSNAQRQGPQAQASLDNRISDLQKDPEATGQKFAGMDANGAPRYEPARTNARKVQELNDLLAKRELRDKLTPEESAYIDSEREAIDTPIEIVPEAREGDPFAANRRAQGQFMGINPEKGTIEIYPEEFKKWLKDVPEHLHQGAVKARLWEEKIHLWVMKHLGNAAADAYWNSISRVERMINEYRYSKSTGTARVKRGISDTMMGHEALRFRMQQLARMTPSELAETAGAEHWTLKGLTVVETAIRAARKAIGTAGSEAQRDILDKIQNSLNIAKGIVGGDQVRPGAVRRDTGEPDLEKVGNDPQDVADAAEGAFFSLRQLRASNADQYAVLDRYEALTDFLDERIDKAIESNDPSRASELDGLKESISKWFSNSETPAAVRRQKSTEYKGEEMFAPDLLRASSGFAKARAAAGGDERVVADADKELYKEAQRIGQERGPAAVRRSRTDKDTISQVQADYDRLFAAPVANLDKLAQRAWYRLKGKQSPELLRAAHNVVYSNNRGENVPEFLANDAAFMEALEARHVPPGQEQRFFAEKELSKSGFGDASAVLSDWPNRRSEVQPVDPALKRWIDRKMFPGQFPVEQGPAAIRRGLTKAEEARETARRKIYDLRQAAEAEAAGTPIEQPNLVKPPSAEHISAEEGGALPRLTPTDIEAKAKQYLEGDITTKKLTQERTGAQADKPPRVKYEHGSFDDFVKWAKNNLGTLNPEQLRDTWVDSVWNHILNASGGRLTEWRKGLGMEHNYGTRRIADAAGEPSIFETSDNKKIRESQQRYRSKVSAGIARRLIKEADQGRANLERDSITNDDIHFSSTQTKVGAFLEIRPSDAEDRTVLETILRDQARATPNDPESASRRLVLLLDKTTGKAHLVSTYNDAGRQMVTDPAGPRVKGRFSRALDQNLLRHYQPVSTVLLKDPVKAFRQTFNSVSDFMDKIGTEASRRSELGHVEYAGEASTGEFLPRGESGEPSAAPSTGRIAAPGIFRAERGSFEGAPERITDAEVGGILRHVIRESGTLESPADVRSSLAALTTKAAAGKLNGADRVAISGYRKAFKALEANFPNADSEDLLDVLSDRIYENYDTAKSDQDFIKRGLAEFQAKSSEPAGPAQPAAIRRAKDIAQEELSKVRDEVKAWGTRRVTDDRIAATRDAADNIAHVMADQADKAITQRSASPKMKGGNPDKLKAANAVVASGALRARYKLSNEVQNELDNRVEQNKDYQTAASMMGHSDRRIAETGQAWMNSIRGKEINEMLREGKIDHSGVKYEFSEQAKAQLDAFIAKVDRGISKAEAMTKLKGWRNRAQGKAWAKAAYELKAELERAKAQWEDPEIRATAEQMQRELGEQYDREIDAGYDVRHDENYIPGRYDAEFFNDNAVTFGAKRLLGRQWRAPKSFPTYYDAIEAGPYIPATRDGAAIVGHRVRQGMRQINKKAWVESLKGMRDPDSGKPVATDPVKKLDAWVSPSPEYILKQPFVGRKPIAVRHGFERIFDQMTRPSAIQENAISAAMLDAGQRLKHTILLGDFFHLGRVGYYGAAIMGPRIGWKGGLTALEIRESSLDEAVKRGVVRQQDADWARAKVNVRRGNHTVPVSRIALAGKFQESGLNVGRIQDAIYKDLVANIPFLGKYNKFLFDKLTRGLMMQSALTEFERLNAARPDVDSRLLMRDIAKDVNSFYGSLGRQGWIKSATFQDLARIGFLAPQWVEGLAKKELGFYGRATYLSNLAGRTGVPQFGTLGRGMGRGLTAMLVLTQLMNLITRRKPTWQNDEEGHKFDAWIPDVTGKTDGFFLSPLSLFNELSHDIVRYAETKPKMFDAFAQIGENKLGPWGRVAMVLGTGMNPRGERITTTAGMAGAALSQLNPTPISVGSFAQAGAHAIAPSLVSASQRGAMQRQAFGSGGLKIEPAQSPTMRVMNMAQDFVKKEGLKKETGWEDTPTDEASYTKLRAALRNGDSQSAKSVFAQLLKTHSERDVNKAMKMWLERPFTGSRANERQFMFALDDKGLDLYNRAKDEKQSLYNAYLEWYLSQP